MSQLTLDGFQAKKSQITTFSVRAFLARVFRLLEKGKDLPMKHEVPYSLKSYPNPWFLSSLNPFLQIHNPFSFFYPIHFFFKNFSGFPTAYKPVLAPMPPPKPLRVALLPSVPRMRKASLNNNPLTFSRNTILGLLSLTIRWWSKSIPMLLRAFKLITWLKRKKKLWKLALQR